MHPIQAILLKLARNHMQLYVRVTQCLINHLVIINEDTQMIDEDGVFELSRGLEVNTFDTAEIRGLLIALCRNDMQQYAELCELIQNTIVIRMLTMVMLNENGIMKLVDALQSSHEPVSYREISESSKMKPLAETHQLFSESTAYPDLIDHLLAQPGVVAEKSKIQ